MRFIEPELVQLTGMLAMFVSNGLEVKPIDSDTKIKTSHTAIFVDAAGQSVATCSIDIETAAALGCALSMVPPNTAKDMAKTQVLSTIASENLYEVMNIFSSLFMNNKTDHLKLDAVSTDDCSTIFDSDCTATAFDLTLGSYGAGKLEFRSI